MKKVSYVNPLCTGSKRFSCVQCGAIFWSDEYSVNTDRKLIKEKHQGFWLFGNEYYIRTYKSFFYLRCSCPVCAHLVILEVDKENPAYTEKEYPVEY